MSKNIHSFIVLVGLPGVGKSTYINNNKNPRTIVLSTDAIVEKMCALQGITYTQGFKLFIDEATKRFNKQLAIALKNKNDIIIDRTNLTRASRKRLMSQVPEHYSKYAYYFPTPEKDEWQHRLASRPGKYIPQNVIDDMISNFDFPNKEEGFDAIFTIA
jgi:predicted kinase